MPPLFRAPEAFFAFPFGDFFALLDFGDFLLPEALTFDFPRFADLLLAADAFGFELFFAGRLPAGLALFFEGFPALFEAALALAATALTAFFAAGAAELLACGPPCERSDHTADHGAHGARDAPEDSPGGRSRRLLRDRWNLDIFRG